jgi:hypothetical protein
METVGAFEAALYGVGRRLSFSYSTIDGAVHSLMFGEPKHNVKQIPIDGRYCIPRQRIWRSKWQTAARIRVRNTRRKLK